MRSSFSASKATPPAVEIALLESSDARDHQGRRFHARGERLRLLRQAFGRGFAQSRNVDLAQAQRLAQMRRERGLAARARELCSQRLDALIRPQIDGQHGLFAPRQSLAQGGGERIGRPAFEAASRDDEIAARGLPAMRDAQRLQRLALEGFEKIRAPGEMQRAIRRRERRQRDARLREGARPAAIRSEPRPGGAAEREDRRVRRDVERRAGGTAQPERCGPARSR